MSKTFKMITAAFLIAAMSMAAGCYTYAGVTAPDDETVVVANNSAFLPLLFPNKVHVCKVSDQGLQGCQDNESP